MSSFLRKTVVVSQTGDTSVGNSQKKHTEDLFPEHRSSRCFVITGLSRFWQETCAEYLTANEILTGPRGCGSAAASSCFTL